MPLAGEGEALPWVLRAAGRSLGRPHPSGIRREAAGAVGDAPQARGDAACEGRGVAPRCARQGSEGGSDTAALPLFVAPCASDQTWGTPGCQRRRPTPQTLVPALALLQPHSPAAASSGERGLLPWWARRLACPCHPALPQVTAREIRGTTAGKMPAFVLGTSMASQLGKIQGADGESPAGARGADPTAGHRGPCSSSPATFAPSSSPPAGQRMGVEIDPPKFTQAQTQPRTTRGGGRGRRCAARGERSPRRRWEPPDPPAG